jgi:hypothetical protein
VVSARKNTLASSTWPIIFNLIQMKKLSVVPNAIKSLKQMVTLNVIWSLILKRNATFVIFVVMAHILKAILINIS